MPGFWGLLLQKKNEITHNIAIISKNNQGNPQIPNWLFEKTKTIAKIQTKDQEFSWNWSVDNMASVWFHFKAMSKEEASKALKRGKISLWIENEAGSKSIIYRFFILVFY